MANRWETVETVANFIFLGSKITADGDSSHEIKRRVSLDGKEIQPVHPEGDQSWVFIGRTDAKAETPIVWPFDAKSWLIWKDPDSGKDWRQEEKGMAEGEMVEWHHWHNGPKFEQTLEVGDGQGGLVCCSPWGRKELDTTELLTWTELNYSTQ